MILFSMGSEVVEKSVKEGARSSIGPRSLTLVLSLVARQVHEDTGLRDVRSSVVFFLRIKEGVIVEAIAIDIVGVNFVYIFLKSELNR